MKKPNKIFIPYAKRRQMARDKAMPEVKKLVKKHGRTTIQSCLNALKNYEAKMLQLKEAEKEVERLKKEVN